MAFVASHALAIAMGVAGVPSIIAGVPATVYVRPGGLDACDGLANTNANPQLHCAKKTIQAGVNTVAAGGTVRVSAGTYVGNVVVTKSAVIRGEGAASTVVRPALSAPNPCANSSLCGGAASNVFLIQASNVTIQSLTVDGDNPALTGVNVGGANIDARNGIIEDHSSGVYNHTNVHDVVVKNVFLRGINAGSGGNDFSFMNNVVQNVQGSQFSVAVFAFDARGTIKGNTVSAAGDAISVNHSRGVKIVGNTVSDSGSGIHVDNSLTPAPGISKDRIQNNTVTDCRVGAYGIWLFVPGADALVDGNSVSYCQVGLALVGGGAGKDITFTGNTVLGDADGVAGILVSTDSGGFGDFDTEGLFSGNTASGFELGAGAIVEEGGGKTATAYFDQETYENSNSGIENKAHATVFNACLRGNQRGLLNQAGGVAEIHTSSFVGNQVDGVENLDFASLDATSNWWGDAGGPTGGGEVVVGPVAFDPVLVSDPNGCE